MQQNCLQGLLLCLSLVVSCQSYIQADGTQTFDSLCTGASSLATLDGDRFVMLYPISNSMKLSYYNSYSRLAQFTVSSNLGSYPRLIALNNTHIVGVWSTTSIGIRARICTTVNCTLPEFQVDNTAGSGLSRPSISTLGPSLFIISWQQSTNVSVRIFSSVDGSPTTSPIVVATTLKVLSDITSIWNGVEWIWVLAYDNTVTTTPYAYFGYTNGTFQASSISLGPPTGTYVAIASAYGSPENLWAVTYTANDTQNVYFKSFYPNGTLFGTNIVNVNTSLFIRTSRISSLPNSNFAVTYDALYQDGSGNGVFANIMFMNGSRYYSDDVRISNNNALDQSFGYPAGFLQNGNFEFVTGYYDQSNTPLGGTCFRILNQPSPSVSPSASPTASVTPSVTPSPSVTPTQTPSTSVSPTPSPSSSTTSTPSVTPTRTPSSSVTPSMTPTPTSSATPSVTPSPSISPSVTPSNTPSASITPSPSVTLHQHLARLVFLLVPLHPVLLQLLHLQPLQFLHLHHQPQLLQFHLPQTSPTQHKTHKNSNSVGIIAGVAGAAFAAIVIVILAFLIIQRRKKTRALQNRPKDDTELKLVPSSSSNESQSPNLTPSTSYSIAKSTSISNVDKYSETSFEKGWKIEFKDVAMKQELGRGAFGIVYKCVWRNTDCVIKLLNMGTSNETAINAFLREAHNVKNLRNHPNVCSIFGVCTDPVAIVMEYVSGGSLLNCFANNTIVMSPAKVIKFAKDIASGMSHLHAENIIHLDLGKELDSMAKWTACRNLLVSLGLNEETIKITDFGLSRILESEIYTASMDATFPIRWTAPETLKMRIVSRACDVWSFGVTIWEMIERTIPYSEIPSYDVIEYVNSGNRLPRPRTIEIPDSLWALIQECWSSAPSLRPSFEEICTRLRSIEQEITLAATGTQYIAWNSSTNINNNNREGHTPSLATGSTTQESTDSKPSMDHHYANQNTS